MKVMQKIAPEGMVLMDRRYKLLRTIFNQQPIGRRALATRMELGERIVRSEVDFLKGGGFVEVEAPGVSLTEDGLSVLNNLREYVSEIKGLDSLESTLKEELGYKKIIVVPGDMDQDPNVKRDLGNAAAVYLSTILKPKDIVAITGGSTIKEMVSSFPMMDFEDILLVPARGSLGRVLDLQSNNLVAALAEKLKAPYKLLNVPDNLSDETLEALMKEREIREVVDLIKTASILIVGIGRADKMAERRGLSEKVVREIVKKGAVGEAFGTYFGKNGTIVKRTSSVGISIDDYSRIDNVIAVSGGSSKAEAIEAIRLQNANAVLITDEGAARGIINVLKSQQL